MPPKDRVITKAELKAHNFEDDYWVAVNGKVYDMTDFDHVGGARVSLVPPFSNHQPLRTPLTHRSPTLL